MDPINKYDRNPIATICEIYSDELFVIQNKVCCKWLHILRNSGDDEERAQESKVDKVYAAWIHTITTNRALWIELINSIVTQTACIEKLANASTEYGVNCERMLDGEITYDVFKATFATERANAQNALFDANAHFEDAKNKLLVKLNDLNV